MVGVLAEARDRRFPRQRLMTADMVVIVDMIQGRLYCRAQEIAIELYCGFIHHRRSQRDQRSSPMEKLRDTCTAARG
jgi:hypothetical protein